MYSQNQKISLRQTYRLFTFDFLGISTLVLLPYLAQNAGIYAVLCIVLGGGGTLIFLCGLYFIMKKMGQNLPDFLESQTQLPSFLKRAVFAFLGWSNAMMAGFVAYVLSVLIRTCLIEDENYLLILGLLLAVAGYAVSGGLESRGRIYEVLFGIILLPLLAMLVMSVPKIEIAYLIPRQVFSIRGFVRGCYMVFLTFMSCFYVLYLPGNVAATKGTRNATPKEICKVVGKALLTAVLILLVAYVILIGTMGSKAISHMEYPIVTLMSTLTLPGGFLTRLDAIMMAVWFFTIFALLNMNLHYGCHMLKKAVNKKGEKRYLLITLVRTAIAAIFLFYANNTKEQVITIFWCVVTPLNILLAIGMYFLGRGMGKVAKRKNKKTM